ncbi:MAG: hypothetical protein QUS35_04360 [bacterium]|nr:hypothetical protein [bacterium]
MKRTILPITVLLAVASVHAQDSDMRLNPTPPPVSTLDFFKGTRQLTVTGIYMELGAGRDSGLEGKPTGGGANVEWSRGISDGFGTTVHFTGLGLAVPLRDPATERKKAHPATALNVGGMAVLDILKGEKRDIAGEIVAKKPTLALFAGFEMTTVLFTMDDFAGSGHEFSLESYDYGIPVGAAADIPLGFFVSILPFGRQTWSSSIIRTTMPFIVPLHSDPYYLWMPGITAKTSRQTARTDYGFDVDLRLFRNAPEWKISVGTVMSQVSGMKEGNLVIMAGVKREWGKHYSSTTFGPKLH